MSARIWRSRQQKHRRNEAIRKAARKTARVLLPRLYDGTPMRFVPGLTCDRRMRTVLTAFEEQVATVSEMMGWRLRANTRPDFDEDPRKSTRESPAAYSRSKATILVNNKLFWTLPQDEQLAILAHEVGHAILHRDQRGPELIAPGDPRECVEADLLACRWSFVEGLARNRERHQGLEYANQLRRWSEANEQSVRSEIHGILDGPLNSP